MGRAKRAIEALAELAPETARVRRDGEVREIGVQELVLGDLVLVRPNERLPADGFVVSGETSINQAPVTGESVPVDKRPVPDPAQANIRPDLLDAAHRVLVKVPVLSKARASSEPSFSSGAPPFISTPWKSARRKCSAATGYPP